MAIGGPRPGAGRKKKTTVEAQQSRRDVVISVLTPARLKVIVEHDVAAAERGQTDRIDRWLPYALGSPKQEHEHSGPGGEPLQIGIRVIDYREGLSPLKPPEADDGE